MKEQRRPASNPGSYAATWSASWAPGQYQSGVSPIDPATLNPYLYFRADTAAGGSITTVGGAVSSWSQVTTGGSNQITRDLVQPTANQQPLHDNSDKHISFDGSDDDLIFNDSGSNSSITQAGIWFSATKQGVWVSEIDNSSVLVADALGPDKGFPRSEDVYAIALLPNTITDSQIEGVVLWLLENTSAEKATATNLGNYRRNQTDVIRHIDAGIDTSNVTSFLVTFYENSAATSFPLLDTSSSTTFAYCWFRNSSLTEFPLIDTSSATVFHTSWKECSSLVQFPLLDVSSGTNFQESWRLCSSLTSFPALDVSSGLTFQNCWRDCSSLTSFPALDMSSGTSLLETWRGCTGLTSFGAVDVSNVTDFSITWYSCNSLTSFPQLDISKGENFRYCWGEMSGLTSFPSMSPNKGQNFAFAWQNCTGVVTFPANFFDSWNPTAITSGVFNDTWDNGNSLTATSVENILVSLAASGKHGTANGASGGTALADAEIDIDYNASSGSLTSATTAAITTLKSRSWGVKINGVAQ